MSVDTPADTGEINLDDFSKEFFNPGSSQGEDAPEQNVVEDVQDDDIENSVDSEEVDEGDEPEVDTEDSSEPEVEAGPKKKKSVQERMNELTRQRYEAERRELESQRQLAALQAEIAQLRNPKQEPVAKVEVADTAPDPEAKLENGEAKYALGEFDPQYIRDLARHTIKQEQAAAEAYRKEAEAAAAQTRIREESQAKFAEKLVAYEAEDPEIQNKIMSLNPAFSQIDERYGQYLIDVVRELDNSPAVLAYLADNPEMARKIVNSGAAQATIALGRLDAQVAKVTPAPKKVTKAPEPPVRTRGTSGQFSVAGDTDDLDAFSRVYFKK